MTEDTIWIASDHGGYEAKCAVIERLKERGNAYHDAGCSSTAICRYPHYASAVASAVSTGQARRGILICSTGIGMSIFANKYPHVRAALCTSGTMARMTRKHNDSNILCMGGKITGLFELLDIVEIWLDTEFEGGRHCISLGMIEEAEQAMQNGERWRSVDPKV